MAPELIEEKPYDHTADIWSLGCIIYELLVGVPPFSTSSLFQLIKKIRYESVQWPGHLSTVARDWLQGTLEKDCRKRLSWPDLHTHPFVSDYVSVQSSEAVPGVPSSLPLTNTLTASQELAKEIQRQDKAKLLPGGSQTLIKVAQKHEIQKQQLAAAQNAIFARKPGLLGKGAIDKRRFSDGSHLLPGASPGGKGMLLGRHNASHMSRRMSEFGQQLSMLPHLAQAQYIAPVQPIQNNFSRNPIHHGPPSLYNYNTDVKTIQSNMSPQSYKYLPTSLPPQHQNNLLPLNNRTVQPHPPPIQGIRPVNPKAQVGVLPNQELTILSQSLGRPPPLQFTQTLQRTGLVMPEPLRNSHITGQLELGAVVDKLNGLKTEKTDEKNISLDSNETLKDDLDETIKSEKGIILEAEDSHLENDEWCEFLDGQLEEMMEELEGDGRLDCVDNPNFLGMIIAPLKNKKTNPLVLMKIVNILMLPLSSENKNNSSYQRLLKSFQDKNIINLLLLSLQISTSKRHDSTDMDEHAETAWAKCMSLLCHLVHCEDIFVDAICYFECDSFLILLASENSDIICDTLAFLSKIISVKKDVDNILIQNITKEVTEELLLDETSNCILIKIFFFLGLTARNYQNCIENRNKLAGSILKLASKKDQKSLLNAVKFAVHFLQIKQCPGSITS